MNSRSWLQAEFVVHGVAQSLLATQIPFSFLYADVPEQELNLLEFALQKQIRSTFTYSGT